MSFVINSILKLIQWPLGYALGILWFDILRIRRNVIEENLQRAFPEMTIKERTAIGRHSCLNLGFSFAEELRIPFLQKKDLAEFEFQGMEHLAAANKKGHGVCLLTLHLGNGDFGTAGLALNGTPIYVISKEFSIRWLNRFWFHVRGRNGTGFIAPRNSSYHILKALKKNQRVAFVMDQFMGPPRGAKTVFFGHVTGTALGLAVVSSRADSPVVPVYTYRKGAKTIVCCEPEIPYEESGDRDQSLAHMTQIYTSKLEDIIRAHPDQWMWVHRRWKPYHG